MTWPKRSRATALIPPTRRHDPGHSAADRDSSTQGRQGLGWKSRSPSGVAELGGSCNSEARTASDLGGDVRLDEARTALSNSGRIRVCLTGGACLPDIRPGPPPAEQQPPPAEERPPPEEPDGSRRKWARSDSIGHRRLDGSQGRKTREHARSRGLATPPATPRQERRLLKREVGILPRPLPPPTRNCSSMPSSRGCLSPV